jgi:two-component system sensor histidine kinase DesK
MVTMDRWARAGRWFMSAWALFVMPSVVSLLTTGLGDVQLGVTFAFAGWAVIWVWFWARALGRGRRGAVVGMVANTVIMSLFALVTPEPIGVGGVLVFCFIVAGVGFPLRRAVWVIGGLLLLQVALSAVRFEGPATAIGSMLNSLLIAGIGVGARLLWQAYTQLLAAREQLAHVAVAEERLRFARDLHDLLGQNLAVLVLKSELVAKQVPPDTDDQTRQELRDLARVARKSLNDVREAAAGYRRPSLSMEIANARGALRAGGIGLLVEDTLGRVAPEQDGVLAWCVREGVTNVVKHSRANQCVLRLSREDGNARLEVIDDGHGTAKLEGGLGLIGLRERVELAGGRLEVGSAPQGGVRLEVVLPAGMPAPSELPVA